MYNQLELREIFHLEFLRWLGRKVKSKHFALKGGANLRFFFRSFRYSEDMDLDAFGVKKEMLLEAVMQILESSHFQNNLKPFGIREVIPPNVKKAKQTETTQRFKTHLMTVTGEDLFTKIEFSRRGSGGVIEVESVSEDIMHKYKMPPIMVPHYDAHSAIKQKIEVLSGRSIAQARDVFDLYILLPQCDSIEQAGIGVTGSLLKKAHERLYEISFERFRDTVISYLSSEDRNVYNSPSVWDNIRLKVDTLLQKMGKSNG